MYDFHYNFIKKQFNAELLFTNPDSLTYVIKSDDVFEERFKHRHLFDFSNLPKNSKFFDEANKKSKKIFSQIKKIQKIFRKKRFSRMIINEKRFSWMIINRERFSWMITDEESFSQMITNNQRFRQIKIVRTKKLSKKVDRGARQ